MLLLLLLLRTAVFANCTRSRPNSERTDGRTMEQPVRGHLPWATDCPDESPLGALSPVLIAALAITSSSICSNERVMKVSTVHSRGAICTLMPCSHARSRSPQEGGYRVNHLFADLGWVDLDLEVPLSCLASTVAENRQRISSNFNQPNPDMRADGSPCRSNTPR